MKTSNLLLIAGVGVAGYLAYRYYRKHTYSATKGGAPTAQFDPQTGAWWVTGNVLNDKGQLVTRTVSLPGSANMQPSSAMMQRALLSPAPSQAATIEL